MSPLAVRHLGWVTLAFRSAARKKYQSLQEAIAYYTKLHGLPMNSWICLLVFAISFCSMKEVLSTGGDQLLLASIEHSDQIVIHRQGVANPILTQAAKADFRPFLHPIVAPDGKGVLTEFSPGHHTHQTGLYWGFTRVNGRDYFHHPEGSYWKRVSATLLKAESTSPGDSVQWQTVYDLLDASGNGVLRESQIWTMRDTGDQYDLDLEWTGEALVDVTVGKYDYGGLFLRMPWKEGVPSRVVNNARQVDQRAEGQRAVWVDVGIQLEGRDDLAHIAIFDHPQNKGFPQPWRVDGQFGIGPVRARLGDWTITKGQKEIIRHRIVVSTGELNDVAVNKQWSTFSGQEMAYAQWQLAQQEGRRAEFLTPEKAVEGMTLQDGFQANVFAAEPMVTQPMAFCWDAKGRMWIAENRDYETRQSGFSNDGNSRIVILEDTDHDGAADNRKVFLEGIPFPSAIAVGMGGLWLGAPPNLLFVPDRDNDDRADMEDIQVRLTGWGIRDRHETLNSFLWGPDGWLYGLQGFATPSKVGKPKGLGKLYKHKEPFPENIPFDGQPIDINGGVWRYHPMKDRFEVVAHGFSNPWGIDYDAKGQLFITACVIPHLWHVIPGGIYHRQGGSHFNPNVYSDIRTIADHSHQSAHGGARVYQSDAFPDKYKGRIFMANIHEHAVLTDILEPKGSGFVGHHGDDFALANNAQWIGFSMEVGPEGAIYVLDWHDADICGKEVLNKETGRVFRISAKKSAGLDFEGRFADLSKLNDLSLAKLQTVESVWHSNHARTILQHRATSRPVDAVAIASLQSQFKNNSSVDLRLRAMWTLHVIGQLPEQMLQASLRDTNEHIRAWAIQLLCEDRQVAPASMDQFVSMSARDASPVVRLYLAAAIQRLDGEATWKILEGLVQHAEDSEDHNLPKLIWFGLEPLMMKDESRALALAESSQIPLISRHIARRLGVAERFDALLAKIGSAKGVSRLNMLLGLRDAIEGRYDMKSPAAWSHIYASLRTEGGETAQVALQLSQQFGDSVAADGMLQTLRDASATVNDRLQALQGLAGRKRAELKPQLILLLSDDQLRRDAIRAMGAFDDKAFAQELLKRYKTFSDDDKLEVVNVLSSRSGYGAALTDALRRGDLPKRDIPAYVARLLRRVVGNSFVDVWGPIDELGADKEANFAKYRELLKETAIEKANVSNGRALYTRACATCHKMYGVGGEVGPDITGANRSNLEYLLSNIITPSAIIQDAYKMHMILTNDGRVFSGIPAEENDRQLTLRVADRPEPVTILKSEIESREISAISMMPEGSLANLKDREVLDLFVYLQSTRQVPLVKD